LHPSTAALSGSSDSDVRRVIPLGLAAGHFSETVIVECNGQAAIRVTAQAASRGVRDCWRPHPRDRRSRFDAQFVERTQAMPFKWSRAHKSFSWIEAGERRARPSTPVLIRKSWTWLAYSRSR